MLVANLAFADFGLNFFAFPLFAISSFKTKWVFGQLGRPFCPTVHSAGASPLMNLLMKLVFVQVATIMWCQAASSAF
ncbi:hypothetical protein RvY_04308 [Ramazzottius varieornatus]|uniref:G-protein coupled receptors family 1 profile domain-containing protein n=1 Tax=Ramazzottius varieornatus TaxID=947166 RepID=A0A1D1UUS1_RAMVA|nr:hypothetical protein RvY_04308 [Ramazzottius varieornatus]